MAETNNITQQNIDFLRFSAYSFKDLITRKLSEDTRFTDQIYEGSNIAVLIDLCAYLFQGLVYAINSAASESMFSDTQIYKNISRLVKLIGYNPKGFIPSTCEFTFNVSKDYDDNKIPAYTAIDTGKVDSYGKKIYYSFVEDYDLANGQNIVKLYNGKWKLYDTIFTASGTKYETFVLENVRSDSQNGKFAAHGFIDVYVQRGNQFLKFKGMTDEIFLNAVKKYDSSQKDDAISILKNTDDDRYFSIRLNENKQYEIKFGNDNNGQKLQANDKVYVFYMDSNGFDAELNVGEVLNKKFIDPTTILAVQSDFFYKDILKMNDNDIEQLKKLFNDTTSSEAISQLTNSSPSTVAFAEENVEDIRSLAPDYYKLGNRLVSKSDFEYYVRNRFRDNIVDVKCQNNWDYISTFYGWLYKLGKIGVRTDYGKRESNPMYYINQEKLLKFDYYYADPADENNVYLWVKMQNNLDIWKKELDEDLNSIKVLTSEMVFVDPIIVNFALCAAPVQRALEYLDSDVIFDSSNESYLEITVNDNALYSNASIKIQVNSIFNQFFKETNMHIGQIVSINDIESQIYNINGVQRIRTVFSCNEIDENGNKKYADRFIDGISFATWSASLIDSGDDLSISTMNRTLEDFQFPMLYSMSLANKIKVIKKSFSSNSTVQY